MKSSSTILLAVAAVGLACVGNAQADVFGTGENQFTIDFVPISGDAGDLGSWPAGSDYTFTGVDRDDYRMGVYEITNDQWSKFQAELGVPVTGDPRSAYDESPYWTGTNVPTNEASWYEAAQFVNWLNISTGHQAAYKFTGTQGQDGYMFDTWIESEADNGTNLYRHKDAFYYLPTEDEWVKAGYWNNTGLQTYATPGDSRPIEDVEANYAYEPGTQPWDVGTGSVELNGTFDMMGNVREWMESPHSDPAYGAGSSRGQRGGSYISNYTYLTSSTRGHLGPIWEYLTLGFRVASEVPEPSSLALLSLGALALVRRRR